MRNYDGIQLAIERAIASLQADLVFLKEVKASQDVIDAYQSDIAYLVEASDVVWIYQDLEK